GSRTAIEKMYQSIPKLDAVIATAGDAHFGPLSEMTEEQFYKGLKSKLMGQVNLVLIGQNYLNAHGSFTLTSGILSQDPIHMGANPATINAAIDGFVKAAALELPNGIRINSVSPTIVSESFAELASFFRGYKPVPAAEVALAYSKSVEGAQTGQNYRVGY
ncbi:MAG TPA: short chain dehydrogenase, partial [Coxiellaceae bacterium]|nr:short chain dehydrogenase [Coxiellaceae bacterium]